MAAKAQTDQPLIVLDMGSASEKKIERLRQGKGELLDDVRSAIDELKSSETIGGNVRPVVVLVKEELASSFPLPLNLLPIKIG